jgi:hypothetical protein
MQQAETSEKVQSASACVSCHRRKIKCDKLIDGCTRCRLSEIPCRYPSDPIGDYATRNEAQHRGERRARGPYKKGKSPREKELEELLQATIRRCDDLERQLTSRSQSDGLSPSSSAPFGGKESRPRDSMGSTNLLYPTPDTPGSQTMSVHSVPNELLSSIKGNSNTEMLSLLRSHMLEIWHAFATRVEPLTKLVSQPTLDELLPLAMRSLPGCSPDSHFLILAICFTAINSLVEQEAVSLFNRSRSDLLALLLQSMQLDEWRQEILQRPSTQILQALTLLAVSLRCFDLP